MAGRFALVIGNSEYNDATLSRLKTPEADARLLAAALRDPNVGSFDNVQELIDQDESSIRRAISAFFFKKKSDDTLLLYFSGHGVLDAKGRLFLAAKDTQRDQLKATAISDDFISDSMDDCRSKRLILILDCCHSGAYGRGKKGSARAVTESTFKGNGTGRVVLTASDSTQYALEGDQVLEQASLSLFTHYLLDGLTTGAADSGQDGWITLDEWYDYAYDRVVSENPDQTPSKWAYKQQGELIIAKNPFHEVVSSTHLPERLRARMQSGYMPDREEAVQELETLLKKENPAMAQLARAALEQLAADDDSSLKVRRKASEVLERFPGVAIQEQAGEKNDQERLARERADAERQRRERAEQELLAREKAEAERLAQEKVEQERIRAEKAEQERLARDKADGDRLAREKTRLPEELWVRTRSDYSIERAGTILELELLLKGNDPALAQSAREALESMAANDDSLRVRSAASEALERSPGITRQEQVSKKTGREQRDREKVDQERQAAGTRTTEAQEEKTGFNWEDWASTSPAQEKAGKEKPALEPSVLKETISVETLGGVATPLLEKGIKLPAETSQVFSTAEDNQSQVEVHLLMGNRPMAADNRSLGKFLLDGIWPAPKGIPQIEVKIAVGVDHILRVTATDKATLKSQSLGSVDMKTMLAPSKPDVPVDEPDTSSDLNDLFSQGSFSEFFENVFGSIRKRNPQGGADLQHPLTLTFEEAVHGVEKIIEYTRDEPCQTCNGSGAQPGTRVEKCTACGGSGEVHQPQKTTLGNVVHVQRCKVCEGRGKIFQAICKFCDGKGFVRRTRKISAKIPAGINTGMSVRLAGEGQPGIGSVPNGNLYLKITVSEHPLFTRQGDDLHLEYPLTREQMKRGGMFKIPTLTKGELAQIKIPPGSAENSTFTINGQGIPRINGKGKGNLVVVLKTYDPHAVSRELHIKHTLIRESTDR